MNDRQRVFRLKFLLLKLNKTFLLRIFFFLVIIVSLGYFISFLYHGYSKTGLASYYSNNLSGKETASGAPYRPNRLTAAHRKIPLGTEVFVINLENNKKVKVTINDRGPYVRGRIIDLSYAAAKKLGILEKGITKVKIRALEKARNKQ